MPADDSTPEFPGASEQGMLEKQLATAHSRIESLGREKERIFEKPQSALNILREYRTAPNCGEYGPTAGWLERVDAVLSDSDAGRDCVPSGNELDLGMAAAEKFLADQPELMSRGDAKSAVALALVQAREKIGQLQGELEAANQHVTILRSRDYVSKARVVEVIEEWKRSTDTSPMLIERINAL